MAIPRNLANIAPHMNASSTELVVNDGGANLDFRVEGDTDVNLLFVDAGNDKLGIGTSSPSHKLDVEASAGNGTFVAEFTNTNSASDGRGIINLVGNSSGAVSTLVFAGGRYFGTDNDTLAVINNAAAGGISFCVGGIANSTRNEKMRLNSSGALVLAGGTTTANGVGITFPATQSASSDANTLDDYEEGTWTPVLAGREGSVSGQSYSQQIGKYTKIGNVVYVVCDVTLSAEGTPGTGSSGIRGLPFTVGATNGSGMCCTTWTNTGQNYVSIVAIAIANETNAIFKVATAATNSNAVVDPPTDFFTNTTRIALMGFYYVS